MLIKHGADVCAPGLDDITPLHDAAASGNLKLVKLLVEKGANPNVKNKKGKSPRDMSAPSLLSYFASLDSGKT